MEGAEVGVYCFFGGRGVRGQWGIHGGKKGKGGGGEILTVEVPCSVIRVRVIDWVFSHARRRAGCVRCTGVDHRARVRASAVARQQLEEARREGLAAFTLPGSWICCHGSLAEPVGGIESAGCDTVCERGGGGSVGG